MAEPLDLGVSEADIVSQNIVVRPFVEYICEVCNEFMVMDLDAHPSGVIYCSTEGCKQYNIRAQVPPLKAKTLPPLPKKGRPLRLTPPQ